MTYVILIVVCLGASCSTYEQILTEASANPATAYIQAQVAVAAWREKHPSLPIARWRLLAGRGA